MSLSSWQAFKIGDFRLVAGFDQRFKTGADERGDAAAEHDLLAEEVRFRFFFEGRLDDAGARTADGFGISQRQSFWRCRWRPAGWRLSRACPRLR